MEPREVVKDKPATKPKSQAKAASEPKAKKVSNAPTDKRLSAIDAALKVLTDSKEPLITKQMVEAMAAKGLWTSPGGKTPSATLYSALLREITTKGAESRFSRPERGKFAAKAK